MSPKFMTRNYQLPMGIIRGVQFRYIAPKFHEESTDIFLKADFSS